MVKCVVSGCPNRSNVNPGIYNHSLPSKRFFNFPADTARVKVWLAALRETEKQDSAEQNQICEDHFLPEDISTDGVKGDAIPIMPPCLEGPLGAPVVKNSPAAKTTRGHPRKSSPLTKPSSRYNLSLGLLTQRFLELLLAAPDGVVDLGYVTTSLQTRRRRVYDITAVLEGISVLKRQSKKPLQMDQVFFNFCTSAYVTHEDVGRLAAFQQQTVIVVKAPEETKLEVPAPKEDNIQVHLKGGRGPIMVLTCEVGGGGRQQTLPGAGGEPDNDQHAAHR
ncbi:hypothetical protein KUCAC02_033011 [Chaenocephalus aceratus]|nr:hypothetical protein KUCAC02_033011 [Chaenocephalus aceratus]